MKNKVNEEEKIKYLHHIANCVRCLKAKTRKETAKEILQTLYNNLKNPQFFQVYIETLAKKYGLKIEE